MYTWGFGDMGQLGHKPPKGEDPKDEPLPRAIDFTHVLRGATTLTVLKVGGSVLQFVYVRVRLCVCVSRGWDGRTEPTSRQVHALTRTRRRTHIYIIRRTPARSTA